MLPDLPQPERAPRRPLTPSRQRSDSPPPTSALTGFAPARWSVGNAFTFVPLRSLDAIRRCRVNERNGTRPSRSAAALRPLCSAARRSIAVTISTPACSHRALGVTEDPATGSAAAALAGSACAALALADGEHRFIIEQGYEMGRPSLIELQLTMRGGTLRLASIGGPAIVVTEGTIEVIMRSLLFVPADSGKKLDKAFASGADALIIDLEDSIAPESKAQARESAAASSRMRRQRRSALA